MGRLMSSAVRLAQYHDSITSFVASSLYQLGLSLTASCNYLHVIVFGPCRTSEPAAQSFILIGELARPWYVRASHYTIEVLTRDVQQIPHPGSCHLQVHTNILLCLTHNTRCFGTSLLCRFAPSPLPVLEKDAYASNSQRKFFFFFFSLRLYNYVASPIWFLPCVEQSPKGIPLIPFIAD